MLLSTPRLCVWLQRLLTLDREAVVCNEASIKGTVRSRLMAGNTVECAAQVSIGAGTVIHPSCSILAEAGPIHIGANNIIEEQVSMNS